MDKNIVERSWSFALSRDEKLYISGHDGSVKVGVKQNCIEKKPLRALFSFIRPKGLSKYTKQEKTLKLEFCEKTSSAICASFDIRC